MLVNGRHLPAKGRLRLAAMTKVEARYGMLLEARKAAGEVLWYTFEGITLKLADDTRYTPDWVVLVANSDVELHENKGGFRREDSWIKLKVAAAQFPFIFRLCTWTKDDGWTIEEV
jgi:hypothetical protein